MHSRIPTSLQTAATESGAGLADDTELSILRDVLRMLPAGVTVQDEHGQFLLVNDAAAVQLGFGPGGQAGSPSPELSQRRETAVELLRAGRAVVTEESATSGEVRQFTLNSL